MEREKQYKGQSQKGERRERRREQKINEERGEIIKIKNNNLMHILISDISINHASTFANG